MNLRPFFLCCIPLLLLSASAFYGVSGAAQPVENPRKLILTPQEKAWLAAHPVVRVRISRTYPPFEFFDKGRFQGISYDHLMLIGTMLGIEFQPTPDMPWKDALESLKNKNGVDLALMITRDASRESFIEFTRDYISFPEVIFTRKDSDFISGVKDLSDKTIATENNFIEADNLRRDVPRVKIVETPTTVMSLETVATGKADAYIGNLAVVMYLIEKHGFVDLKVAAPSPYPEDAYAMGVRKDWPELARILDKAIVSISDEEHRRIDQKWLSLRYEHGIRPGYVVRWVLAVAGILLVFIVQLRRMVRKRTIELEQEINLRKESEEQLHMYINRLPIACLLWGKDGRVQSWNPAAERIFGYSEAEAIGKSINKLIVPEWVKDHVDGIRKQIMAGEYEVVSINENVTRDGRTILCEWTNTPFFCKDGTVAGVISVGQDISERRRAEEAMIQNEKMTMIAGMAAGMAHEVNNPLGIIAQDLQNMERRLSPALQANCKVADELGLDLDSVGQYLERRDITTYMVNMRSAVKRASSIVSNMLQFSRQSDASHHLINLNEIIDQSIKLASSDYDLRKKYDFKNMAITREYDENLPKISVCTTEMEQVFINLLKNSAQAMSDAGTSNPSVQIRTFVSNECVFAVIKDNGPGMSDTVRQRLFDPFFTTKDIGAGTGLGMSVSYTIVSKNHGGELSVESTPGHGACFTIRLPFTNQEPLQ